MKTMSTVLEIIALGLSFVLVFKLGCVLELLGCFKQCAQATSYTNYLRISRGGTQESVILKAPQLIAMWDQISDAMVEYFVFQQNMTPKCPVGRAIAWYKVEIYLGTLEIWKVTNLNQVDVSQNIIYDTFQWHISHSYWLIKYISKN